MPAKDHIGDGVYAEFDGYGIVLTTENGIETTNSIVLDPEVLKELDEYRKRVKAEYPEARV